MIRLLMCQQQQPPIKISLVARFWIRPSIRTPRLLHHLMTSIIIINSIISPNRFTLSIFMHQRFYSLTVAIFRLRVIGIGFGNVRSFDTKSTPWISRKPFDLESPNFMGASIPTLSAVTPGITSLSTSGRQQIGQLWDPIWRVSSHNAETSVDQCPRACL